MIKNFKRFCAMILVLLITLFSAASCNQGFEGGDFNYIFDGHTSMMMGVRSKTDTFPKDEVSFELYYGFFEAGKQNVEKMYTIGATQRRVICFAMYVCDMENTLSTVANVFEDYKNIEGHHFLKDISNEEVLSGAYGWTMSFWTGIQYQHNETVTIPSEIFTEGKGDFVIKISDVYSDEEDPSLFFLHRTSHIKFHYDIIENDRVKITFY